MLRLFKNLNLQPLVQMFFRLERVILMVHSCIIGPRTFWCNSPSRWEYCPTWSSRGYTFKSSWASWTSLSLLTGKDTVWRISPQHYRDKSRTDGHFQGVDLLPLHHWWQTPVVPLLLSVISSFVLLASSRRWFSWWWGVRGLVPTVWYGLAVIGGSHTGSVEQGWARTPRGIGGRRRCLDSDSIFCGWAEFGVTQWHHVIVSHCHPALWNYGAQLCSSWNCHSSRYPFDILDPCPSLCLLFSFFRFLSFCFFVRVHFYSLQSSADPTADGYIWMGGIL